MRFLLKFLTLLIFLGLMGVSYIYTKRSLSYNYKEPDVDLIMKDKLANGYLDSEIKKAIEEKRFKDITIYTKLADRFGIELKKSTKDLVAGESTTVKKLTRGVKNFVSGFVSGEAESGVEVAGAITSDFTLYGDLRDISKEGRKFIEDRPYDKLILGVSMAGVALSASQLITLGGSSSLKVAASSLKIAKRQKALTKGFSKIVSQKISKSIDFNALKSIKYGSLKEIKNSSKIIKNSVNLKPLKPLFNNLHTIQKNTSVADSIHLLKYIDNTKELKSVAKLSKRYKGATRGIFKIMGKNIFKLVKVGIKWSKNLILSLIGFAFSSLGFLLSLIRLFKS